MKRLTESADPALLRAFADLLEVVRPELDAAVEEAAHDIPVFAALLEQMPQEQRDVERSESLVRERRALRDGDWDAYLENLRAQGALYAEMGIDVPSWFGLLRPYREVVLRKVLPPDALHAHDVLSGMSVFLDIAMASIANSYVERKEQLVQKAEARLQLYIDMFRYASMGMVILEQSDPSDPSSFVIAAANPAAAALSGPVVIDGIGKPLADIAPGAVERGILDRYVATLDSGEPQSWTATNEDRAFECKCFPLGSRHVGLLFDDVTERHRMQADLRRYVVDLERSNRELDQFAYVASHDLKAPLRDIQNLAGWIRDDAEDALPEPSRRHLTLLCDRVGRMERLLEDLLDYSRAGRMRHATEELRVMGAVDNAIAMAAVPEGFRVEVRGHDATLRTQRVPLEQVLRNLISNGVKHHHRDEGVITVEVEPRDGFLHVAVGDDGPGIPERFQERVFGMFTTLRPRDEVEGSGMGLAIVKKVVESHGGEVHLESAEGEGTTMRFTWPLSPQEAGA